MNANSDEILRGLYEVVQGRKEQYTEGSYTCYLFEKGLDKILKKCGEECSEVIIAAKNQQALNETMPQTEDQSSADEKRQQAKSDTENEICDLLYHLLVLMVELDIPLSEINEILAERRQKIGNLKTFHVTDHNS